MNQEIDVRWDKEKLNSFLKQTYGYGIWEFELSLYQIYIMYFHGLGVRAQGLVEKRIKQLENIKRKILELMDKFLTDINFYRNSLKAMHAKNLTGISKWTTENREKFIIKNFKIEQLFSIINKQIQHQMTFEAMSEIDGSVWGVESPMRLKPLNFLVLVWSYAMKKGKKVDWINMENLLKWFSKKAKNPALSSFFEFDKGERYPPEILRLSRNKYKNSKYDKLAHYIYKSLFKDAKEELRKEYPEIINRLKLLYVAEKPMDTETLLGFHDLSSCLAALFPDFLKPR